MDERHLVEHREAIEQPTIQPAAFSGLPWVLLAIALFVFTAGCGTARTTDSTRTATEQLLISDAVDRALEKMSFQQLSGYSVFLDTQRVEGVADKDYVIGAVREKLAAEGAALRAERSEADVIVELFVGALGTNRYEWFMGIPQVTLPPGALPTIPFLPELPVVKEIKQQGVAKIEAFAYDAETGMFIAHSGSQRSGTNNKSVYFLGLGPFESGTVTDRIKLAGSPLPSFGDQASNGELPGLAARHDDSASPRLGDSRQGGANRDELDGGRAGKMPARAVAQSETADPPRPFIRLFFRPVPGTSGKN